MNEITAIVTSIKAAYDISKSILSISQEAKVNEKATDLLNVILSLQNDMLLMQAKHSELLKEKDDLEKKLSQHKDWEEEKSKYLLSQISQGVYAYTTKENINSNEPKHWLCQNCFDNKKQKSILQRKFAEGNDLICFSCNSTFRIPDNSNSQRIRFSP